MYKQAVTNLSTHTTLAHAFYAAVAQGFPLSLGTKLANDCFLTHATRAGQQYQRCYEETPDAVSSLVDLLYIHAVD